jgi:hypothetical protein
MIIVLNKEIVFATGLTYKQGCNAMDKIAKLPIAKKVSFSLASIAKTNFWELRGTVIDLNRDFISDMRKNEGNNHIIDIN